MKHILSLLAISILLSCKDVSNGGAQTNPDSATRFDNPNGEPAGGGIYSTDSTDHNNTEPQWQGGAKGTGNSIKKKDAHGGYNNDTSNRIMNPGPAGDDKQSNVDSSKEAEQ